jgi:hypothetical protein
VVKHEQEVRRAKAKSHVAWCNKAIHEAPWTRGDLSTTGGIYVALEMAEQAYRAHRLRYEEGSRTWRTIRLAASGGSMTKRARPTSA